MIRPAAALCAALVLSGGIPAAGQTAPAKSADSAKPRREQAVREFLKELPPEQRRKVMIAVKRVWQNPDVAGARQQLHEAAESYKNSMREAVGNVDPDVRDIVRAMVERLARDGLTPGALRRGQPEAAPRFFRALGVTAERFESLSAEERQMILSVRERVMNHPRVRDAAASAESAEKSARPPAMRALRQAARQAARELEPKVAPILDKLGESGPSAE